MKQVNNFPLEHSEDTELEPVFPGFVPHDNSSEAAIDHWTSSYEVWQRWRMEKLRSALQWTDSEHPKLVANITNAAAFLRLHPDWYGVLAFDEFMQVSLLMRPIPGSKEHSRGFRPRPIRDTDYSAAQEWLQKAKMQRLAKQAVTDAMDLVCQENRFDPLREYIVKCGDAWDGTARINRLFEDYFVAETNNAYLRELGPKSMMTLVLRALFPGAFQKMVPILEGKQDIGKSKGIAALCPDLEWFGDSLPPIHNKDASSYLRGKFLVEIAELSATKRADIDELKSFITRSVEKFRPAYGRKEVEEQRRCMFWGSTNREDYLRDETGNCRFYPVRLAKVEPDKIAADRDQLLGEAAVTLEESIKNGENWWDFSAEAVAILEAERQARDEDHPWTATVLRYVEDLEEVSVAEILQTKSGSSPRVGLGIDKERCERKNSNDVAGILKRHGWRRDGKITSGRWKGQARYVRGT